MSILLRPIVFIHIQERYLTERYDQLMQVWLKKIERIENNAKRK